MVVLGGAEEVLKEHSLVEHALRQTLTLDIHAMQFKLPPSGTPMPPTLDSPSLASGAPLVECLVVCSTWIIQLLKHLCLNNQNRELVAAGIVAVSSTLNSAFTKADANRFAAVVTDNDPAKLLLPVPASNDAILAGVPYEGAQQVQQQGAPPHRTQPLSSQRAGPAVPAVTPVVEGQPPRPPSSIPIIFSTPVAHPGLGGKSTGALKPIAPRKAEVWETARPPLPLCTESEFLHDLARFLTVKLGRQLNAASHFPAEVLNGIPLDAFALYKGVCARGGYSRGNSIDWAGEIFGGMRNFVQGKRVQGIGNALKMHYQMLLLEYEQTNPRDVATSAPRQGGDEQKNRIDSDIF